MWEDDPEAQRRYRKKKADKERKKREKRERKEKVRESSKEREMGRPSHNREEERNRFLIHSDYLRVSHFILSNIKLKFYLDS